MQQAQQRHAPYAVLERTTNRIVRRACGKALRTIQLAKRVKWFAMVGKNDLVPVTYELGAFLPSVLLTS